jgi:hypothetical protein
MKWSYRVLREYKYILNDIIVTDNNLKKLKNIIKADISLVLVILDTFKVESIK